MRSCHKFLLQAISPAEEPMLNLVPKSYLHEHHGNLLDTTVFELLTSTDPFPYVASEAQVAMPGISHVSHDGPPPSNHLKFWASTITSPTLSRSALVPGWVQMLQCSSISRNWALNLQPSWNNRKQENATDSIGFTNMYLKFMYFTSETSPNLWLHTVHAVARCQIYRAQKLPTKVAHLPLLTLGSAQSSVACSMHVGQWLQPLLQVATTQLPFSIFFAIAPLGRAASIPGAFSVDVRSAKRWMTWNHVTQTPLDLPSRKASSFARVLQQEIKS